MEDSESAEIDQLNVPNSPPTEPSKNSLQVGNRELTPEEACKASKISSICENGHDIHALICLATTKYGLVHDEVRRKAWPFLLGYGNIMSEKVTRRTSWRDLPCQKDEDQVQLDVHRSFVYYPKHETEQQLDRRKKELSNVITQILREHPTLSYFQGFHDIVQVFLLVLGIDDAPQAVAYLSLLRIRDFMLPSLSPSLAHLKLLPNILRASDPALCHHLSTTQPFFALSATLTLYAHEIQEYSDIARLFDFLLAQPAVVSVYFFAVIILSRRDELFEIPADEPEMLHSILSKMPKPLDLEALIVRTMLLFDTNPPESLPNRAWSKISPHSVLKTTRLSARSQTLVDGVEIFEFQALELRREELRKQLVTRIWIHRRSLAGVGLTLFIGGLSIWLGRDRVRSNPPLGWRTFWNSLKSFTRLGSFELY